MCCQPQSDFLNRINELPGGSKGCQACQFFRDHQTSCNCKKERFWEWWLVSTIWVGRNIKFIEQIFELDNPLKLQVTNASKCAPPNDNCPKNNRHWLTLLSSVVHLVHFVQLVLLVHFVHMVRRSPLKFATRSDWSGTSLNWSPSPTKTTCNTAGKLLFNFVELVLDVLYMASRFFSWVNSVT